MRVILQLIMMGAVVSMASCDSSEPPPSPAPPPPVAAPTSAPVVKGQHHFEDRNAGIAIDYPDGWQVTRIQNDQSTLRVQLPSAVAHFTLNVPQLPWHPTWLLTIDRVKSHYIDDRKKKRFTSGVTITDEAPVTLPNAQTVHLKMHGPFQGQPYFEEAVMIVHNDKAYVLDISGNDPGYPAAKALLDMVLKSLKWVK